MPRRLKILLLAAAAVYQLSPIDLIPGVPVDDFLVWLFLIPQLLIRLSPAEAVTEAMYGIQAARAEEEEDDDRVIDVPWRPLP